MFGKAILKNWNLNSVMKRIPWSASSSQFIDFGMCDFFKKERFLNGQANFSS